MRRLLGYYIHYESNPTYLFQSIYVYITRKLNTSNLNYENCSVSLGFDFVTFYYK